MKIKQSCFKLIRDILSQEGILSFWSGFPASIVLTVNPAITYGLFARLQSLILASRNSRKLNSIELFWLGAFTKSLATLISMFVNLQPLMCINLN
jgi:solute carrier family 25 (peroxisomal adenine nucleotide transporter), member 17